MLKRSFLLFIFLLLTTSVFCQQGDKDDFYIRGAANYGYIAQHHDNMGNLINGNIYGLELNYVKPSAGNKLWQYENNFPEKGVGFTFFNLDNPKQLGNIYAAYGFYDIPLRAKEKKFRFYLRLCPGIAYLPVYFDPITNHKNNVISTPINAYVNFKFYWRWNITQKLCMEVGINLSHASNGSFSVPNQGLNMITLNGGFVYKFLTKNKTAVTVVDSSTRAVSKNELLAWLGYGGSSIYPALGKRYLAQTYSFAYYRNVRNTHKWGIGVDVYYNPSNIQQLRDDSTPVSNNFQNIQLGVKLAYAYNIGRLSLPVEMGVYALSKYKDDGLFFHRIGMRYYFKNNFVAVLSLKTHWAIASYFEFGAGYRFPLKNKKYETTD